MVRCSCSMLLCYFLYDGKWVEVSYSSEKGRERVERERTCKLANSV